VLIEPETVQEALARLVVAALSVIPWRGAVRHLGRRPALGDHDGLH
jgi:hypothetical protein